MSKVVDLSDDFIETVDLANDDLVEIFSKIGVVKPLGKKLREGFDRNERIANFVGHTGGQVRPKNGAIEESLLFAQSFLSGKIIDDSDGTQRRVFAHEAACLNRERAARLIVDPLLRRQNSLRVKRLTKNSGQLASGRFDRLIQDIRARQSQNLFGGGIEPADNGIFIGRH